MINVFLTSLLYLILIMGIYFSKKTVENKDTKIYRVILIVSAIGIIIDISQALLISNYVNKNIILLINRLFIIYINIWTYLFAEYVFNIGDSDTKISYVLKCMSKVGLIVFILLSLFLPIDYYYDGVNKMYSYGLATISTYASGIFFCTLMIVSMMFNYKKIDKNNQKKYLPLVLFLILTMFEVLIQSSHPEILLISPLECFLTILTYFFIENPDVKMLREMEIARNQADRANNAKSDFLSSMSHEIRTPLNAIVGLSEDNLRHRDELPPLVVENSEDIMSASQTLLEIVGNILDISKIESGKLEITNEVYNPREIIETLAKINATRIGEKPIDFKMNIAEDLPYELMGDKLHVKQIINNLLSNAFKYTEKGEVELTVKCINQNDYCNMIISVRDTGRGIKAEDINKLFTKFERLDIEKNTTTEGTGLGLAITKTLVEMMGGKINVQSQFGEGSLFVVSIPQKIKTMINPLTNTQVIKLNEIKMGELKSTNYGKKKVLIVDDNKLNIKVAKRALEDFDFEIDECYDGLECLEKVKVGNEYDLILMDIMMPNMGGETCITKLKENSNFNIPTIALTADAVAGAREHYIELGFTDYIAKPFSRDQIKEKLDLVFGKENSNNIFKEVSIHTTINDQDYIEEI